MDHDSEFKYRQGQMAARLKDEAEGVLGQQERKIINKVMQKLNSNEVLDPQFAIQQWLELYSVQRFRRVLLQREREGRKAGADVVKGAEVIRQRTGETE